MSPKYFEEPLSHLEYHVLLALAGQPLYGYAIKEAVSEESGGALQPRAGSLYRVLARLMVRGMVAEAAQRASAEPHPGLERKYYALTAPGRTAVRAEALRRREAAALAERRLGLANRRGR
jgi:DNA-binding PadR family transcriptional regulator